MNSRGSSGYDFLTAQVVYIVLSVLVFIMLFYFVARYQDGAAVWSDFYAKELALMIDSSSPGTSLVLDVSKPTALALRHGVDKDHIFDFDNRNNYVLVHLTPSETTRYPFFRDVDVSNYHVELVSGSAVTNQLFLNITEATHAS